jgi:hypothetical protein
VLHSLPELRLNIPGLLSPACLCLFAPCPLRAVLQLAWVFNSPVNTELFKDYTEHVSEPMDFGTMMNKVETKQYNEPAEVRGAAVGRLWGGSGGYGLACKVSQCARVARSWFICAVIVSQLLMLLLLHGQLSRHCLA